MNARSFLPYVLIAIVGFALYFPVIFFGYTYLDDNVLILQRKEFLTDLSNLPRAFTEDVFHQPSGGSYYRPLLTLSFMFDARLGGSAPFFYHLTNLLLHLLAACLVFALLMKLQFRRELSLLASLFFTVHPVLAQAAAWLPGRNDSLLAVFVLASFLCFLTYIKERRWPYLLGHLFFFLAALLTKETAVVLPIIIILYAYLFRARLQGMLRLAAGWGLVIVPWFLLRRSVLGASIGAADFDVVRSLATNLLAVLPYIGKIVFPVNLSVLPILRDLPLIWGLVAIALAGAGLLFSKNKRPGFIIFGIAWLLLFLLPSFIRSASAVADFSEHRIYLSLIGFILVCLEIDLIKTFDTKKPAHLAAAGIVLLVFSAITFRHEENFRNRLSFWKNAAETSPNYAFNHNNLGAMYFLDGEMEKAEREYKRALALNPAEPLTHNNLGLIYMNMGKLKEAEAEYLKELKINPLYDNALFNLGLLYARQGKLREARRLWQMTLEVNPGHNDARKYLELIDGK